MRRFSVITSLLLLVVSSAVFLPTMCKAADTDAEIQHLKDYVGNSECIFIRNGTEYSSADALKHINLKHGAAGRRIKSTEDFIRLAATKSSISGKPYKVRCGGSEMPCADWLYDELFRYREEH